MEELPLYGRLMDAIWERDAGAVREICRLHPEVVTEHIPDPDRDPTSQQREAWTCYAVRFGWAVVEAMLDSGFDINALNMLEAEPALTSAIDAGDLEIVEGLLKRGANPNLGRPVISAFNCESEELRLPLVRLLIEHGADVNKRYDLYGDWNHAFTALDCCGEGPIADYLRSRGAKHAAELKS